MNRRHFLGSAAAAIGLLGAGAASGAGRLRQSVARWCFGDIPIDNLCKALRDMGVTGMDLVGPEEWDSCKRYGITPCMVMGAGSFAPPEPGSTSMFGPAIGWSNPLQHDELVAMAEANVDLAADAGLPNVIGLFGNRNGTSDEEGIEHSITGLRRIVPLLERRKVTLAIELLNSKVDHPDYQGDNTAFGVEVCRRLGSERVKLVYDAYHMQIMEGNLIETIRANIDYIAHFHVAGVPGRHEIDETQEVNWRAVARAIADTGFDGYVAHEWLPSGDDPLSALREAVEIMTV